MPKTMTRKATLELTKAKKAALSKINKPLTPSPPSSPTPSSNSRSPSPSRSRSPPHLLCPPTPVHLPPLAHPHPPPPTSSAKIPPILIQANSWRKIAQILYNDPALTPDTVSAKASSNGQILIQSASPAIFRIVQKILISNNFEFTLSKLPEERTLKVVIRGIPTDIANSEIQTELHSLNFEVRTVKRFGPPNRPMPIVLIILAPNPNSRDIFNLSHLFYLNISVEKFKQIGPAQCFKCQRFGHSSLNCVHPARCVECSGPHLANTCPKTPEQAPTCCNCGEAHTANFRGCPFYTQILVKPSKSPHPLPPLLFPNLTPLLPFPLLTLIHIL